MKISHKLIAGFLGSSLLLAGLGITFLQTNAKTQQRTNNIAANVERELTVSSNLTNSVHTIQFSLQEMLFADDELGSSLDFKKVKRKVRDNLNLMDQAISMGKEASFQETETDILIDKKTQSDGIALMNKINVKFEIYKDHVDSLLHLISQGEKEKAIDFWLEDVRNISEKEIIDLIEEYQKDSSEDITEFKAKIDRQKEQSEQTIRLYLFFSALMSVGLYLYIYRSIYAPFDRLKDLMTCRALNSDRPIKIDKTKDELETFADTLQYLTDDLSRKTQTISDLNEILNAVDDSIIILDSRQNIQKVNRATLEILGYSEKELIDKNINLFLTEKNDLTKSSGEATYLTKTKKKRAVLFSIANIFRTRNLEGETTIWMAKNITRQYQAERELAEIQAKYSLIGRGTALWEWNLKDRRLNCSPGWKAMLGYEDNEIGNTLEEWFKLVHADNIEEFKQKLSLSLKDNNSPLEITYKIKDKNGSYRTVICRGLALRDKDEKIVSLVGSQIDITQRKLLEKRLDYEILYDRLTRLPNRRFLIQKLQKSLDRVIELTQHNKNYLFALILLDIDRFKKVNDTMGYLAGDQLLIDITQRIKELLPERNAIARLEANKFALIIENIQSIQEVKNFANKIQETLTKPFNLNEDRVYITASIGIALNTKYYKRAQNMVEDAKIALYTAKDWGRNSYAIFEPPMHLDILKKAEIEKDLQIAIEQQQLDIFYKPILEINNKKIIGLEAVIRWQHRKKGEISPASFIPIAEETGAIVPLSWSVMEKACSQMNQWQKQYSANSDLFISVDVYSSQFLQDDFIERVNRILWQTGLHPSKLKLEISEQTIKKDFDRALQKIQRLKVLGVGVYVDNCAKDYSSLIPFKQLPVDTFKLDPSLVDNIENDPEKFAVLETVINLISNKGIDPIVQGVDKIKQTDLLKQLNCEYAQGAFFSGLLTNEIAEALIANQQARTTS